MRQSSSSTSGGLDPDSSGGSSGTSGAEEPGEAIPDVSSPAIGACESPADVAGRARSDYSVGDETDLTVTGVSTQCTLACFGDSDLGSCISSCILEATGGAVSPGCVACDTNAALCAVENCLGACVTDSTSAGCIECRCGSADTTPNCVGDFEACSGTISTVCVPG